MAMQIENDWQSVSISGVVLTIGNFDGVHRGHQAILARGRELADAHQTALVAMTFDPHPLTILTPKRPPETLTPTAEKLRLLEEAGVDTVVLVESTPEFLNMTAADFIQQVIVQRFAPKAMVEGASFGFGRGRQGDVRLLQSSGAELGFAVEIIGPIRIALGGHPDAIISSSLVRQLIRSGTVDQAAICLNRPYLIIGQVIHGAGRGAGLGFPTANLDAGTQLVPADGVYAGFTRLEKRHCPTAISIGSNPTFGGVTRSLEAHLLDYEGDLYEQELHLGFLSWLREQQSFPSPETLKHQIQRDVEETRAIFARR
jgi:riboflavin kinase/FMN adenylyltransferase